MFLFLVVKKTNINHLKIIMSFIMKNDLICDNILSYSKGEYLFLSSVCKSWYKNWKGRETYLSKVDTISKVKEIVGMNSDGSLNDIIMDIFLERIKLDDLKICNFMLDNVSSIIRIKKTNTNYDIYSIDTALEYGSMNVFSEFIKRGFSKKDIYPQVLGRRLNTNTKNMMIWMISNGFNLSPVYTEAIWRRNISILDILKDLKVPYESEMWKRGMTFGRSDERIMKWITDHCNDSPQFYNDYLLEF